MPIKVAYMEFCPEFRFFSAPELQGVQTKGHGTKGHRTKGHRQKATRQKATGQKATERNVKMLLSYQDVLERLRVVFFKK